MKAGVTNPRPAGEPCFSFTYGGKPSGELLSSSPVKRNSQHLDEVRIQRIVEWTDPDTGLQGGTVAIEYHDYPTVEWMVRAAGQTPWTMPRAGVALYPPQLRVGDEQRPRRRHVRVHINAR